jgi:hypothetical protein
MASSVPQIRALQALSTFYVGEQAASPGCSYPYVAVRCVAHFLDLDAEILQRVLEPLAALGFCELTRFEARLTPSRWALNRSRYSSFLSFYVANAPFSLRGPYSQLPIDPKRCYNPQPQLEGQNTTIASNFNGVYSSSKYRENCEPSTDQGPYELIPPAHGASQPELSAADNLNFLFAPGGLLFRSFLCSMWLQGFTTSTAYGPVTFLLADYPQQTPCLVAAPSDALCLQFQSPGACWSPLAFVAAVCPGQLCFESPCAFPMSFTSLAGGSIVLNFNGTATVSYGEEQPETLSCFYQLVGPCLGDSFLVSLLPCGPTAVTPQLAHPCPL